MPVQIGKIEPVDAELSVVDDVTKITTVCPVMLTLFGILVESLINPVPDKPTL